MNSTQSFKATGSVAALAAILLAGMLSTSARLQAQDSSEGALVQLGYSIAPVPLNLTGKDQNLVGLGSYLVNAVGDCNGCHTAGNPPPAPTTATPAISDDKSGSSRALRSRSLEQ
jgi:hypothetical protein